MKIDSIKSGRTGSGRPNISLSGARAKVLTFLAKSGATNVYQIGKKHGMRYSTVHKAVKDLEKLRFITLESEETTNKGTTAKVYGLTLRGLGAAIASGAPSEDMDKIAEKWGYLLPFALGKWSHYKSAGLGEEFIKAFNWVTMWILEWGFDRKEWATERFWFYIFEMRAGAAKAKWLKALRMDPELRQKAIEVLKDFLAEHRMFMKIDEKSLQTLEMTAEPDWDKVINELRWHAPPEHKRAYWAPK